MKSQLDSAVGTAEAYDLIIDAIVSHKLAPSQKVSENILADMFGISRTIARNVMEQLIAQRFMASVSPRITRVASLTLLDVKQNFVIRKMLQPNMFTIAAPNIVYEEFAALNENIQHTGQIKDDEVALQVLKANKRFNMYVAEKAKYPLLIHWNRQLEDMAMRIYWLYIKMVGSLPYTLELHQELLEMVKADKREGIRDVTLAVLSASEERVLKALFMDEQLNTQDLRVPT